MKQKDQKIAHLANRTKVRQSSDFTYDLAIRQGQVFVAALKPDVVAHSDLRLKPLDVDLCGPLPPKLRVYLYNATHPPGGRTTGEHKIQIIVPGPPRGVRGDFDYSSERIVMLAGYEPDLDVFVLWGASLYRNFAYSRNVQVKGETVYRAFAGEIGTQVRRLPDVNDADGKQRRLLRI